LFHSFGQQLSDDFFFREVVATLDTGLRLRVSQIPRPCHPCISAQRIEILALPGPLARPVEALFKEEELFLV
jgi:hypothetical protein